MKILIISGYTPSLYHFRGDLIKHLVSCGFEVVTTGPEAGHETEICGLGARFIQLPLERTGSNPIRDIKTISRLFKLMTAERPDMVLGYTIKPVIYGSIAARLAGVKRVFSMVTGLGYVFLANGIKGVLIKAVSKALYSVAFKCCDKVFFQNPDDINEFVSMGLIKTEKCVLTHGSGVNIEKFKQFPLPKEPVFLMMCRIIRDKGVMEYLESARRVKLQYTSARFLLLGPFDTNPNTLTLEDIEPYIEDGTIEYLGEIKDVRPYIANCSVYVLPSYREGTPRTVLEAMAMGRPVITTDAPGCRETVIDGVNGFLVPIKDIDSLVERMIWMIVNKDEVIQMAEQSRRICCEKYDVNKVNGVILRELGLPRIEMGAVYAGGN